MIDLDKVKFRPELYPYRTVGQTLAAMVRNLGMPAILAALAKIAREQEELEGIKKLER